MRQAYQSKAVCFYFRYIQWPAGCCGLGGPALAVGNGDDSDCEVKREVLQCSDWDG